MGKWIWTSLGLSVALGLLWLVGLGMTQARFSQHRTENRAHLKQILLAVHLYHDAYHVFPPAYVADAAGHRLHSWRVLLLPYLGQEALYEEYDFSHPWDSPQNSRLKDRIPDVYRSPFEWGRPTGTTPYLAVVESRAAWPGPVSASTKDVHDGMSNTIGLISVKQSALCWLAPDDISLVAAGEMLVDQRNGQKSGTQVAMMDGAARFISSQINRDVAFSILTRSGGMTFPGVPLEPGDRRPLPELQPIENFPASEMSATPLTSLTPDRNQLYCSTLQIAWDRLRDQVRAEEIVLGHPTELATLLNESRFRTTDLDPESYFAAIDRPEIIESEMKVRYPGLPVERQAASSADTSRSPLICFADLSKSLPFAIPFKRLEHPLEFQSDGKRTAVTAFGVTAEGLVMGADDNAVRQQVHVLDYVSDDDFILELQAKTLREDVIVIGKFLASQNLERCWEAVERRSAQPSQERGEELLQQGEVLQVPVIAFNLRKNFPELVDQQLLTTVPGIAEPQFLRGADQVIGFRLDESGAELVSWNEILVIGEFGEDHKGRARPRNFLLNSPFFIALKEKTAQRPYFMAWIGNSELLSVFPKPVNH